MKKFSSKKSKKLSILVGMALTCSVAFGIMPSDVAEAASSVNVVKTGDFSYKILNADGTVIEEGIAANDIAQKIQIYTSETGATVVLDKGTAQALQSGNIATEGITLGAGTTVKAQGSASSASVVGGSSESTISIDGASIKGNNVNLKSITVDMQGDTSATIAVSGTVETLTAKGAGNGATLTVNSGNLQVTELTVDAPMQVNGNLSAQTVTIADGANIGAGTGTIVADTVKLESGATIANGANFQVSKIEVEEASSETIDLIKTISQSSSTPITVEGTNLTADEINNINTSVGGNVSISSKVTVTAEGDTYKVGKENVSKSELLNKVNSTLAANGVSAVELDKAAAQALRDAGQPIALKANQTLIVSDTNQGTVSATTKSATNISVSGTSISASDGAVFSDVTVDVDASNTIYNNMQGATIDNLNVKNGSLSTSDVTVGNLNLVGGEVVSQGTITVKKAATISGKVTGGNIAADGAEVTIKASGNVSSNVKADSVSIAGTSTGSITADTIFVAGSAKLAGTISADLIKVADVNILAGVSIDTMGSVVIEKTTGEMTQAEKDLLAGKLPAGVTITIKDTVNTEGATLTGTGSFVSGDVDTDKAIAKVKDTIKEITGEDGATLPTEAEVELLKNVNPFEDKLPTAGDISKIANITEEQSASLSEAKTQLYLATSQLTEKLNAATSDEEKASIQSELDKVSEVLAGLPTDVSVDNFKKMAAKATAYVQQAGKTAAAPSVTSARTANVIINVMTQNVVTRTAEIRGFASAVDEGRPAPEKVWFQYKHTNMDVDGGDVYSKSTINTNNFQLGYDTQIGTNDYLGAYIGTTTGNADFRGPARDGRVDIENAFDFGVYGTHMLPNDQYIDYMIHTGKFDSKLSDVKYGTKDTGAMVGYGLKIAQTDNLTLNPYVQLSYDKVSVDDYIIGGNTVNSDSSNNWTAKLGLNLIDASGFYGGLAYSRGLSGSYNAYLNGVPMPTQDNNANVIYLSMGYRAMMSKNALLDLSMEKTFADYRGWTAAGKINFYF